MEAELHPLRSALAPIAEIEEVWFVGGAVRTALTGGGTASEADLIIAGDAAACAKTLADAYSADRFRLSADFGSWRVSGGNSGSPSTSPRYRARICGRTLPAGTSP